MKMAEPGMGGESEQELSPWKDVPVVNDQGVFRHDTGDIYEGFFEARKKDRIAKMHGPGTYTTAEGDVYSGTWEADRLVSNEEVSIKFTDGSRYQGMFNNWAYNGQGKYIYPDNSVLTGNFVDNVPMGNLTLIDPNGHEWQGKAEQGYAWLDPVNHLYEMLDHTSRTKDLKKSRRSELLARSTMSKIKTVQSVINEEKVDQVDMK